MPSRFPMAAVLAVTLTLISCGGGSATPTLQSISISPASSSGPAQFVATGVYSNGKTVTPLPVDWSNDAVVLDPPPAYHLTATPFTQPCVAGVSGSFVISAFAPQNPNAPSSGSMPMNVWQDMIHASVQSEGGFVSGSAHLNCP